MMKAHPLVLSCLVLFRFVCGWVRTCLTPSSNRGFQDGRVLVFIALHIPASSGPKGWMLFDPCVCGLQKLCVLCKESTGFV